MSSEKKQKLTKAELRRKEKLVDELCDRGVQELEGGGHDAALHAHSGENGQCHRQ